MKNTVIRALFALLLFQIAAAFANANGPGNLDLTFAGTGYVRGAAYPSQSASKVVVRADGKILVLGIENSRANIARFNPEGSLDTSFGNGGRIFPGDFYGFSSSSGVELLLQPDGKIIFVGAGSVIRLDPNGTPDTTFDGDGRVEVDYYNNYGGSTQRAALGADGKIAVKGLWVDPRFGALYSGMAVYNSDGSYDTSFGVNGRLANSNIGSIFSFQADGKMIGTFSGLRVIRNNANGSRDMSFDGDGVSAVPDLPETTDASSILSLPDGKILVGGYAEIGLEYNFCIVRYNNDGSLDTTFNGTGTVKTPVSAANSASLNAFAVQSDGKIVAGGSARLPNSNFDIALVRYNVDGSLDTTYGSNGKSLIDPGSDDFGYDMTLDSADRAVVVGPSQTAFVARITSEAAPLVEVSGRVTSTNGQGIGNATIILKNANNERRYALTNAFGYYGFSGVSSNEIYTVSVSNKRYRFQPSSQTITLMNSVADVDFVGNQGSESRIDMVISDEKSHKSLERHGTKTTLNAGKIPR